MRGARGEAGRLAHEAVLDPVLRVCAWLGWLYFGVTALTSWHTFLAIATYAVLPIVGITFLAIMRGHSRLRAGALIGAIVTLSFLGFVRSGPLPGNYVLAMTAALQAGIFLGRRAAFALVLTTLGFSLGVGHFYASGTLVSAVPIAASPAIWGNWARFAVVFAAAATTTVLAVDFLVIRLSEKLAESARLLGELRVEQAKREALEEERARTQAMLAEAQKVDAIGRLAGGVAHDFRNSLSVIQCWVDVLKDADDRETRREGLAAIASAAASSAELTQHLLAVARREHLDVRPIDLSEVVRAELRELGRAPPRGITMTEQIDPVPAILADRVQIARVLTNLVLNAREAMAATGGTIHVSTALVPADETPESAPDRSRAYAVLIVSDTGPGIPKDQQSRVFEPFFSTKGPGESGLGLSIVLGVAAQARGYVVLESDLGRGARFTVGFPVATEPALESAAARAQTSIPPTPPAREAPAGAEPVPEPVPRLALVIDDEPLVAKSTARLLRRVGYDSVLSSSADEALAVLEERDGRFDLVCSDGRMPGMRVVDLLDTLRRRWPDLPVLVCSGYMDEDLLAKQTAQRFAFLMKPFGREELTSAIAAALEASRGADAPSAASDEGAPPAPG